MKDQIEDTLREAAARDEAKKTEEVNRFAARRLRLCMDLAKSKYCHNLRAVFVESAH